MTVIVVVVSVCLVTSFLCSLCEAALYAVTATRVEALRQAGGSSGRKLAGLRERIDEAIAGILTLNTIPSILNRDEQGRLRKKIVVLKIERWIARYLLTYLGKGAAIIDTDLYSVDMSSKNPRWRPPTRY